MTEAIPALEFLSTAYSVVDGGWKRTFPWVLSTTHRDCYGTIYVLGDKAIKVHVNRTWIKDATAAVFDINNQIRRAGILQRCRRESQKHRTRGTRPGKRQREAQRAV
jgi:hypothetical protein